MIGDLMIVGLLALVVSLVVGPILYCKLTGRRSNGCGGCNQCKCGRCEKK